MRTAIIGAMSLAVGLTSCGGGGSTKTVAPSPSTPSARSGQQVRVAESEFKLDPGNLDVKKSGPITIMVHNKGKIAHSLAVEGNGIDKRIPGTIAPGSSKTLQLTLKPGKYEWYCPVDGHKGLGMKGEITVAGAPRGTGSPKGGGGGGSGGY
jgi:plastocyanin